MGMAGRQNKICHFDFAGGYARFFYAVIRFLYKETLKDTQCNYAFVVKIKLSVLIIF